MFKRLYDIFTNEIFEEISIIWIEFDETEDVFLTYRGVYQDPCAHKLR